MTPCERNVDWNKEEKRENCTLWDVYEEREKRERKRNI